MVEIAHHSIPSSKGILFVYIIFRCISSFLSSVLAKISIDNSPFTIDFYPPFIETRDIL